MHEKILWKKKLQIMEIYMPNVTYLCKILSLHILFLLKFSFVLHYKKNIKKHQWNYILSNITFIMDIALSGIRPTFKTYFIQRDQYKDTDDTFL